MIVNWRKPKKYYFKHIVKKDHIRNVTIDLDAMTNESVSLYGNS